MALGALVLGGCAQHGSNGVTAATAPVRTIHLGSDDNGHAVSAAVGSLVVLTLAGTTWTFSTPTGAAVELRHGPEVTPGAGCTTTSTIEGLGCGATSTTFAVVAPGTSTLVASRTNCGEALRCIGGAGHFEVTIVAVRR